MLRRFDSWLWSDAGGGVASAVLLVLLTVTLVALAIAPLVAR
ncbi:MAG: hypothetical protein ACYCT1_19090 [Steroidobacteraceae bacterium]